MSIVTKLSVNYANMKLDLNSEFSADDDETSESDKLRKILPEKHFCFLIFSMYIKSCRLEIFAVADDVELNSEYVYELR